MPLKFSTSILLHQIFAFLHQILKKKFWKKWCQKFGEKKNAVKKVAPWKPMYRIYLSTFYLSYLEVALLIRESGGTYAYWYEAFGRIPAFLVCWFWSVIDGPSGCVIVGLTFAQYVAAPFYPGCYPAQILVKIIAFASFL